MDSLSAVIIDILGRTAPVLAAVVYAWVIVHRAQVDCMRTFEHVHQEMRRLSRRLEGEDPEAPEPTQAPEPLPMERAPLPVARIHTR